MQRVAAGMAVCLHAALRANLPVGFGGVVQEGAAQLRDERRVAGAASGECGIEHPHRIELPEGADERCGIVHIAQSDEVFKGWHSRVVERNVWGGLSRRGPQERAG